METPPMPRPTSWFHWVLIYPTLALSLLGATPTAWQAIRAWQLDVTYQRVQIAEAQQELWEKNLRCLEAKTIYSVKLPQQVTVGVTVCPSGDALLRYEVENGDVSYTWIRYPVAPPAPKTTGALRRQGVAWAQGAEGPPPGPSGRSVPERLLPPWQPQVEAQVAVGVTWCNMRYGKRRIVSYTQLHGRCTEEHIDVRTGQVLKKMEIHCGGGCPPL